MPRHDANEQVLQGTLDLLVLKTLSLAPMHGWGLTHRIEQLSQDALRVGQGSIYPALVRLEQRGWIDTEWRVTENSRRAKYYRLTQEGRQQLRVEVGGWARFTEAMGKVQPGAYEPDEASSERYDALYAEYDALHEHFGRGANDVMHRLSALRRGGTHERGR